MRLELVVSSLSLIEFLEYGFDYSTLKTVLCLSSSALSYNGKDAFILYNEKAASSAFGIIPKFFFSMKQRECNPRHDNVISGHIL
jgi:hypothetical protein